jgi:predicted transposase/invertase (TIGR01784 family)
MDKYINPFTDFGFKKLFGEEANKDLLIDFLNALIQERGTITDLTYLKTEQLGVAEADRKAIFDLYCQNHKGEKFIVELQKAKQEFFKDRSLYYSTFAIQEQAPKGEWDYQLQGVYTIAVMDFRFDEWANEEHKFRHDIQLLDIETKRVFYNKLRFIYLEMPKYNKTLEELETRYEKWLYLLRNLSKLDEIPEKLREKIFMKIFEIAEIAKYDAQQQLAYQSSLKYYRDWKNSLDTALKEGKEEGRLEGRLEGKLEGLQEGRLEGKLEALKVLALNCIQKGFDNQTITEITGLSFAEIEELKKQR